jgi:hypothetical protein
MLRASHRSHFQLIPPNFESEIDPTNQATVRCAAVARWGRQQDNLLPTQIIYRQDLFFFYILMGSYSSAVIHRRKVLYLLLVVDDYSRYTSGFLYLERSPKLFLREIYRKF